MRVFSVLVMVLLLQTPCAAEPALGTVEGTVTFKSKVQRVQHAANPYGSSKPAREPLPETSNCVVFLEADGKAHFPPPAEHARMDQKNESFVPHVLPVLIGTVVDFYNSDPYYHNVFSLSSLKRFDLGRYPKGQRRSINFGLLGSVRFDQPGVVPVFCEIHSHMTGYVVILTSPWFMVPNTDGRYALRNVPPGNYRLRAWHDRLGEKTFDVKVTAGAATRCDVAF